MLVKMFKLPLIMFLGLLAFCAAIPASLLAAVVVLCTNNIKALLGIKDESKKS
jgi:hypothetical protein